MIDSTGKQTYTFGVEDMDNNPRTFYNLIFQLTPNNEPYQPYLLKYTMDEDFALEYFKTGDFSGFKGTISKTFLNNTPRNLQGNVYAGEGEEQMVGEPCPGEVTIDDGSGPDPGPSGGGSGGGTDSDSDWGSTTSVIRCEHFVQATDWYKCLTPDCSVKESVETTYEFSTECSIENSQYSAYGGDDSCDPKDEDLPIIEPLRFEELIDDSKLKPCLKAVLADVKNLTKGMGWVINRFDINSSSPFLSFAPTGYNWTVKDAALSQENAKTSSIYNPQTKMVTTEFDPSKFVGASELSIARTIMYESIHAFLIAHFKVDRKSMNNDYQELLQDYGSSQFGSMNNTQHVEFVRNWLKDIALSLEEYGKKKGYNLPFQFYQDMSWGGLTDIKNAQKVMVETDWFKFFVPNTADRQRIKNVLSIEQSGRDLNGNVKAQKGKSGGC